MLNLIVTHFDPNWNLLLGFPGDALENVGSGVTQESHLVYLLQPHRVTCVNPDS